MNTEQKLLFETIRRFVTDAGRPDAGAWAARTEGTWPALAGIGLLGIAIDEGHGGTGGSARDVAAAMEAWGHGLLRAPIVGSAVVGATLIARAGSPAQRQRWLPEIARGACRVALADLEAGARYDRTAVDSRAQPHGTGFQLKGAKANIVDGDVADLLLVTATITGDGGPTLFLVPSHMPGVERRPFASIDGGGCAHVEFHGVALSAEHCLGRAGSTETALDEAVDRGLAALCSEAVGAMQALLAQTVAYLQQRQQFGQPLARFQALQHQVADMALDTGAARSAALMAAAAVDAAEVDTRVRRRAVAAAKCFVGEAGRRVGETAVQLHGGMGMTDELAIGHHFKRLHAIDLTWGDAAHHLDVYSGLMDAA
jgi:alkylation response protein AidB-like acyl-CoA dehydrogenase